MKNLDLKAFSPTRLGGDCIKSGFCEHTIIKNFSCSLWTGFKNMTQTFLIKGMRTPTCLQWFCFVFDL